METMISGKPITDWINQQPVLSEIVSLMPVFWLNPERQSFLQVKPKLPFRSSDVADAAERLSRFRSYLADVFAETKAMDGLIESPVQKAPSMQQALEPFYSNVLPQNLFVKLDSHLAISGSIKARGGIYEVLKFAESVAIKNGLIQIDDDYSKLSLENIRDCFSRYSIMVGSTGNLGLSIGIMGAKLGFKVSVHMSADAKQWKKDLLRAKGVDVVEYEADYSHAVAQGREQAEADPYCHFVDDENSKDLFLGYAVAADRLKKQLDEQGISVDQENPLFVYLPCGVGGGPGGIAYGLKLIFGDHVHCFFGEPVQAPAMLVGLVTGLHDKVSAKQFGISGKTDADGLAVSRPSGLVCKTMQHLLSGVFTVSDDEIYQLLTLFAESEGIHLEPSATVGFSGFGRIVNEMDRFELSPGQIRNSIHLVWATGGAMVPNDVWEEYNAKGTVLLSQSRK